MNRPNRASPAATGQPKSFKNNRVLQAIAVIYATVWLIAAISPTDRFDWLLENLLVFVFVGLLAATYRAFTFSNLSYGLMAVFLCLHAVGAHYNYSHSPIGFWLQSALDMERNHYDRVIHFLFGLLFSYPLHELARRAARISGGWCYLVSLALILACSNFYEIVEWATAEIIDPEAAFAFLGTQGDVFDAQKDTVLALAGAILGLSLTALSSNARVRTH